MGTIEVIVIDQEDTSRALTCETLSKLAYVHITAETDSLLYGYELVRQNRPAVVFIDLREDGRKSLEIVNRISTYFKETMVILTGPALFPENLRENLVAAMQAGAREYLQRPLNPQDILITVEKHRAALMLETGGDRSGRLITVFSNKGGLGKTTIAVNLALALSEISGKPVALVDLNLQLGDITTFLDIMPKQTIVDIARNIGRVDLAYLESSLALYSDGNASVYILADPLHVEEAEEVTADQINTVLTVLKASFEYVIVDTTTSFDAKTLTSLDLADHIVLVSMVNLPCIRSTQRVLNLFERLSYDAQKVKLVINRYVPDEEITLEDVEETLEHEVFWKIPNNYHTVMTAINRGIPIRKVDNSEKIYQNFIDFARQLSGYIVKRHLIPTEGEDIALPKSDWPFLSLKTITGKTDPKPTHAPSGLLAGFPRNRRKHDK